MVLVFYSFSAYLHLQEMTHSGSVLFGLWADFGSRIAISENNVLKDLPLRLGESRDVR